ncbi:MAG: DoxX family protein [Hyphomicrobiales bacterium]
MEKLVNLVEWAVGLLAKFPHVILATMARAFVGLQFYRSGVLKFDGWFNLSDTTIYLFTEEFAGVPLPPIIGAHMAAYAEVTFGLFLLIGFASRFSALGLLTMTAVIEIFVYPEAYILHGLWAVSLLYVIKYGPCMISVDYFVKKKFGSK